MNCNTTNKKFYGLFFRVLIKTGVLLLAIFLITGNSTFSIAASQAPFQNRVLQKTYNPSDFPENIATFLGADGTWTTGIRCGAPSPTRDEAEKTRKALDRFFTEKRAARDSSVIIPVVFHIVRHSNGSADVTDTQINAQMAALNSAYRDMGYQFILQNINRVDNTYWSTSSEAELTMKINLAVNPASTLNIYTCDLSSGLLGYSYLPSTFDESSFMNGVVVLYSSMPGGTAYPYDEGDTATHEVGHYLGLYHTFENGCSVPGDEVDDTPYEASSASGCPLGRDSCPEKPGRDPIHNFMDYSYDACMEEFTINQGERMDAMVATYKPTLWNNEAVFPDVKVNGSDSPVSVSSTDPVQVSVSLYPGSQDGQNANWWIAVHTSFPAPNDWLTYVYPSGWRQGIHLCAQMPLFELYPPLEVLNMPLPVGNYTFYFVVDELDGDSTNSPWTDSVEVTVK